MTTPPNYCHGALNLLSILTNASLWPQKCRMCCKHIEINIMCFGASKTTYLWIQSILFNYNFLKKLSNLFKTFQYLLGFDGERTAAGSLEIAAFWWCVRESACIFVCFLQFCHCRVWLCFLIKKYIYICCIYSFSSLREKHEHFFTCVCFVSHCGSCCFSTLLSSSRRWWLPLEPVPEWRNLYWWD